MTNHRYVNGRTMEEDDNADRLSVTGVLMRLPCSQEAHPRWMKSCSLCCYSTLKLPLDFVPHDRKVIIIPLSPPPPPLPLPGSPWQFHSRQLHLADDATSHARAQAHRGTADRGTANRRTANSVTESSACQTSHPPIPSLRWSCASRGHARGQRHQAMPRGTSRQAYLPVTERQESIPAVGSVALCGS